MLKHIIPLGFTLFRVIKMYKYKSSKQNYFSSSVLFEKGLPSIKQCGEALNLSGPYLSDLLRLETGRSAKDYIHSS